MSWARLICRGVPPCAPVYITGLVLVVSGAHGGTPLQVERAIMNYALCIMNYEL